MKKLLIIPILFLFSFQSQKEDKKLTVQLTPQQWQVILNIMEKSEAPHVDVTTAEQWIVKQLTDTTFQKTIK